ncbi:hypothetical protein C8F04DRAFT_1340616 [Mycena alexandri]|uniref:Uncharacterized protein n=1 Tax=Mycena alexandri TaxID=1745969 RepID=A0AAD6WKC2_9AGAR|nr:hypothetical protein C8F04DRAFT_1340616 [Mycena alexandri]
MSTTKHQSKSRGGGGKRSTSARRPRDEVKESEGKNEHKSQKRRRTSPGPSNFSAYQNPFGPYADVPLSESTNEPDAPPPPRMWTQVPQDQYTYGFTPALTVQEQEIGMSAPPYTRDSFPPPDATTPSNAPPKTTIHIIDPSLSIPTLHSLQSPSNPFAVSPSASSNSTNPFAKPIRAPPKEIILPVKSALHTQTPTPAPSSSRLPPPAIPKAITDKLMNQAARITELESMMQSLQTQYNSLKIVADERADAQIAANRDMRDVEDELQEAGRRATAIEDKLGRHHELITQLFDLVKIGSCRDDEEEEVKLKKKGKKSAGRDNALNASLYSQLASNATRRCLYIAMGLPATSKLKDAAKVAPKKRGGGYIDDEESNGQLLRPDWRVSFGENACWHTPMVRFLRNQTPSLIPALTKEIMAKKADDVLLERLEVLFTNTAAEYRKIARDSDEEDDEEGDNGDDEGPVDENQLNRRSGRKVRKCKERIETIEEGNIDIDVDWDWFFQPVYQSTDESDASDIIDPDTETEAKDEPPARSTRKPWVTHAPDYRSQRLQNGLEFIDKVLMERRRQWAKNNHGKTLAHNRIRGEKKHKPLPFIKGDKPKIKRSAIDAMWLANNPKQDTPSRIQQSDNEAGGKVKVPAIVDDGSSHSDSSNS